MSVFTERAHQEKALSQLLMGIHSSLVDLKPLVSNPEYEKWVRILEENESDPELVEQWPWDGGVKEIMGDVLISQTMALENIFKEVRNIGFKKEQSIFLSHTLFKFYDYALNNEISDKYCRYLALYTTLNRLKSSRFKRIRRRLITCIGRNWYGDMRKEAYKYLFKYFKSRISEKKAFLDVILEPISFQHLFLKQKKEGWMPETLKFRKGEGERIGIFGDSGTGKTFLSLRVLNMFLEKGYTILSIAEDKKKALRCACLPCYIGLNAPSSIRKHYKILTEFQGEKPKGLNIAFFVPDPYFDIIDFPRENFDISLLEKGGWIFHVEGDIRDIIQTFAEEQTRKKYSNLVLFIDEIQNIHPKRFMTQEKETYNQSVAMERIYHWLRGSGIITIINTLEPRSLPQAAQFTYVLTSYIGGRRERSRLRDMFKPEQRKSIETVLSDVENRDTHIFFHLPQTTPIKPLVPSCSGNIIGTSESGVSKFETVLSGRGKASKYRNELLSRYNWLYEEEYGK